MKTFIELAQARYSVKKYESKLVENEKLATILQAGRVAPTAANQQPNTFLVLQGKEVQEKLGNSCSPHGAPLAIVVSADKSTAWIRPFDNHSMVDIDATIATDHMMMAAQDLGLSSCWITWFDPVILRKDLNMPENLVPVNILVIGYGADKVQSPTRHDQTRKPIESYVQYTSF